MTLLSARLQPKGHIRLVLSDVVTGEIQQEIEIDNVVLGYGETAFFMYSPGTGVAADLFGFNNNANFGDSFDITYITERPVVEDKGFVGAMVDSTAVVNGSLIGYTITRQADPLPDYVDIHGRINPGVSTRNIWAIGLGRPGQTSLVYPTVTYASLLSPCIQLTTQVLDIFYRVQFFTSTVTGSTTDVAVALNFDKTMNKWFMYNNNAGNFQSTETADGWDGFSNAYIHGITKLPANGMYATSITDNQNPVNDVTSNTVTSVLADGATLRWDYTFTNTTAQNVGRILGFVAVGGQGYNINSSGRWSNNFAFAKFGSTGFSYKPVQSIFNHSAAATQPFLDVSNLATGQGSLTVGGSGWTGLTTPQYPDFYRVDIRGTGAVGATYYAFSKRNITGLCGNGGNATTSSYQPAAMFAPFGHQQSFPSGHNHDLNTAYQEQYSDSAIVTFTATGISVYDWLNSVSVNFDSTTSPALPVNSISGLIQQVCVDGSGNIWVADANSGLYKITSPFSSPTVTHMTNGTNGIPAGGDTACYGVALGNGKLWAIFNGGLSYTTNSGTSWTNTTLTFTGDFSTYSSAKFMRADPQSSIDQLAFVVRHPATDSGSNIGEIVFWWDSSSVTLTPGTPFFYTNTTTRALYSQLRCSKTGSYWALISSNSTAFTQTPGSSSATQIGTGIFGTSLGLDVVFWYDGFGNPYLLAGGTNVGAFVHELFNKEQVSYGVPSLHGWSTQTPGAVGFFINDTHMNFFSSGGVATTNTRSLVSAAPGYGPGPSYTATILDPRNAAGTLFEDMVWRDYRWNGSAWTLGFNAPALDTGGSSHDGTRVNFGLEDHTFTGRSYIDVTPMLVTSNFSTATTFAAYINPTAKPLNSEANICLADIYDPSTSARLAFYWNKGGNIALVAGSVTYNFGATPANGSNYRVVFVVNGTSASAYVNGTQSGSTATIVSQDLSNTGGNAQGYVGSRTAKSSFIVDFFKGSLTNAQFWNGAWNSTDISTDNSAPTSVISSPSNGGANVKAVYALTNSLATLETKITSSSPSVINDGITIAFNDGISGNSFVNTDYYTFGVVDGVLKDNAINFTWDFPLLMKPNQTQTTFTNPTGGNTVPSVASTNLTETATWSRVFNQSYTYAQYPGTFSNHTGGFNSVSDGIAAAVASQTIASGTDGYVQFVAPAGNLNNIVVGFAASTAFVVNSSSFAVLQHSIALLSTGQWQVYESGVAKGSLRAYVKGDTFKIDRTGGTVTYLQNNVVVYTSLSASTGTKEVVVDARGPGTGVTSVQINYSMPAGFMSVGSSSGNSGIYDPLFRWCDYTTRAMSFVLGGTPLTASSIVTVSNQTMDQMVTTGAPAGGLLFNTIAGKLYFNSANYGNTLTGSVIEVTDQ